MEQGYTPPDNVGKAGEESCLGTRGAPSVYDARGAPRQNALHPRCVPRQEKSIHPSTLAWTALILLGLYSVISCFFPALETPTSYRILVITTVIIALLFIHSSRFKTSLPPDHDAAPPVGRRAGDPEGLVARRKLEMRLSSFLLGLLALYVLLTFAFPALLILVSLKILSLTVILISLVSAIVTEKTVGSRPRTPEDRSGGPDPPRLGRRFFVSVGILLFLPTYLLLAWIFPSLERTVEMRVLILAIVAASLVGFWAMSNEILAVRRLLRQAKSLAQSPTPGPLPTAGNGEIGEVVETINLMLTELGDKARELEAARQRVETLAKGIGNAITSTGKADELQRLVVETAREALRAEHGFLYVMASSEHPEKLEVVPTRDAVDDGQLAAYRRHIDLVVQSGWACEESDFVALPLISGQRLLGVLGLQRAAAAPEFTPQDTALLRNVAHHAALAIESAQRRESETRVHFRTLSALAMAVEARDPYTRGHSQRVSAYATAIAESLGLSAEDVEIVRQSGLLHDIGKVAIPDMLLRKAGPLSADEHDVARQHAVTGEYVLKPLGFLQALLAPIRGHHERFDGKGYPDGLAGEAIDIKARILAVADAFDAMLSERPHRSAFSLGEVKEIIAQGAGTQFDPRPARALLELLEQGCLQVDRDLPSDRIVPRDAPPFGVLRAAVSAVERPRAERQQAAAAPRLNAPGAEGTPRHEDAPAVTSPADLAEA